MFNATYGQRTLEAPLTAQAVEELHLRRTAGDGAQQAVALSLGLFAEPAFISASSLSVASRSQQ